MRKKVALFQLLYYILITLLFPGFLYCFALILKLTKQSGSLNLGAVIAVTYFFTFLATPCYIAIAMRFSLLRWYVDPIAAFSVPLSFFSVMVFNVLSRTHNLSDAFRELTLSLNNDGGEGWFFFGGLFLFGLLASFSVARTRGNSISYRLLKKFL